MALAAAREDNPWYPTMRLFRQRKRPGLGRGSVPRRRRTAAVAAGDTARLTPFKAAGENQAKFAAETITLEAASALPGPSAMTPAPTALPANDAGAVATVSVAHLLLLAEQRRRGGYLAEAEGLCQRALAADSDNAEAEHLLGIIAHQSGRLGEAIAHLRRAVKHEPRSPLYHANLGEMCRLAGRTDEAVEDGRRAIALKPDYPEALSNLGIALYESGKYAEALACYDGAIALRPDYAQAHSNRGNALHRLKRLAEAEAAYRIALRLQPGYAADAWNNLGTYTARIEAADRGRAGLSQGAGGKPNDPDTLDNLALALKDLDRHDEAEDLLRRALTIEARNDKIHVHLRQRAARPEESGRVRRRGRACVGARSEQSRHRQSAGPDRVRARRARRVASHGSVGRLR